MHLLVGVPTRRHRASPGSGRRPARPRPAASRSATRPGVFRPSPVTSRTTRSRSPTSPRAHRLAQRAERDRRRRLAEHAGRLGEQRDVLADLVLGDGVDRAARRARGGDRELPVGGAADRERARDRARPHRPHLRAARRTRSRPASSPRPGRRSAAATFAVDEPELEQLAEALVQLREHRARRDRRDDGVRQLPAELLGDLERDRLRALGVVRAELDVDERPVELERQLDREPRAVVVAAVDGVDRRAVDRGRDELLRLEVGRARARRPRAPRRRRARRRRSRGCRSTSTRASCGRARAPSRQRRRRRGP